MLSRNFPTVFTNKMTYEETLLKVVDFLNETTGQVNTLTDAMSYLQEQGLSDEVLANFNSKISDGTLGNLINGTLLGSINTKVTTNTTNIGTLSNLQTTDKSSLVNAINNNVTSLSDKAQKVNVGFRSVLEWGAVADANYYNATDKKYYKDSGYTILATDNTNAFNSALNSGYNITIPEGNYYLSTGVIITKSVQIKGSKAKIYFKSKTTPDYGFFIKGDFTTVEGITIQSVIDQTPYINSVAQTGQTSNVIAFMIEANSVVINNCNTVNCDRGVDRSTMVSCENLYITNCNFTDCAFGIFAFYIKNMYVSNCYISCNNTGLAAGFHCMYLSDYAENVFINNVKMLWKTDVDGALFQCYSARSITMKNIHVNNCEFETYGNHAFVLGYTDGLYVKDCVFNMKQVTLTAGSKILYSHGTLTNIRIKGCTFNIYRASLLINGSNTDEIKLNECTINIDDNVTNSVLGTTATIPQSFTRCTFRFKNFTSGQLIGAINSLRMMNTTVYADSGKIQICNGMMTGQYVELVNSVFLHKGVSNTGQVIYNWAAGYGLKILSCKFYGFAAMGATDAGTGEVVLVDNLISNPLNR